MAKKDPGLWLASTPSKRWGELFILACSPFWIVLCLGIVVPFKLYEKFQELEYLLLGIICALPYFLLPLLVVGTADRSKPWYERFWFKANLWIFIFGYVGNYFWTHYFFTLLGATYTFPSWRLNNVPIPAFLLTHAYFMFYHAISNVTLRRLRHAISGISSRAVRWLVQAAWIFFLSYLTALAEAVTISNFPYYEIQNRKAFYAVGSFFYAIYFLVSFPMFIRVDEIPKKSWTVGQTAVEALGAAMLVSIILDLWRLILGPIIDNPGSKTSGLPWLH